MNHERIEAVAAVLAVAELMHPLEPDNAALVTSIAIMLAEGLTSSEREYAALLAQRLAGSAANAMTEEEYENNEYVNKLLTPEALELYTNNN